MDNWYKTAIADLNKDCRELDKGVMPTYCCVCHKHIRGYKSGHDHPSVSHGYCDDCLKIEMQKIRDWAKEEREKKKGHLGGQNPEV